MAAVIIANCIENANTDILELSMPENWSVTFVPRLAKAIAINQRLSGVEFCYILDCNDSLRLLFEGFAKDEPFVDRCELIQV